MLTNTDAKGRSFRGAVGVPVALLLLISLVLPVVASAAQEAAPKKTPIATPITTPAAAVTPQPTGAAPSAVAPTGTASPAVTPSPTGPPTITPTATSTRAARPLSGLVLVPLGVRQGAPAPGVVPERGAISGRIREASGRGLWGQVVRVSRQGFSQSTQTGDDGVYTLGNLDPGVYSVVVENQICTPAEGVRVDANQTAQVDFTQIRPAASAVATGTPARTATPSATPKATRTPVPPTATASPSPSPTPRTQASPLDITRWWDWLGFDLDLSALASHLYLGIMGGFLVFAIGVVIAIVRR